MGREGAQLHGKLSLHTGPTTGEQGALDPCKPIARQLNPRHSLDNSPCSARLFKSPDQCGSVGWTLSLKAKSDQFNSWSGHMLGL